MHTISKKAVDNGASKRHYNKLRSKAGEVINYCRDFYGVLPAVKSDLDSIPKDGVDKIYFKNWSEHQKKMVKEKITDQDIANEIIDQVKDL